MPRFAANLSMMYTEHDFLDRFAAASADGFEPSSTLPYATRRPTAPPTRRARPRQVLFNAPPGGWDAGERGMRRCPAASEVAPGSTGPWSTPPRSTARGARDGRAVPQSATRLADSRHLPVEPRLAAEQAAAGADILIEPINGRDMPGYFLHRQAEAHAVGTGGGSAELKVQLDLYHCQIVEGDLTTTLRRDLPTGRVGHLQIAGVPDRHEPDRGELDIRHLFGVVDDLGFDGWIGCEYVPRAGTSEGLGWLDDYRGDNA